MFLHVLYFGGWLANLVGARTRIVGKHVSITWLIFTREPQHWDGFY